MTNLISLFSVFDFTKTVKQAGTEIQFAPLICNFWSHSVCIWIQNKRRKAALTSIDILHFTSQTSAISATKHNWVIWLS